MKKSSTPAGRWAYSYELVPPQGRERLRAVKAVLDDGQSNARLEAGSWEGRMIQEDRITHILVVSDSPDQDLEVNRRLENELAKLDTGYFVTLPMEIAKNLEPTPVDPDRPRKPL